MLIRHRILEARYPTARVHQHVFKAFGAVFLAFLGQPPMIMAVEQDRPNILWLIAEDFGQHLGCYGTPEVDTPNLDSLANAGMRFTHCFTTAPVCSASRSAFMTGMYQTTLGAHHHRTPRKSKKPLPEGVKLLTDWLRQEGYFTANVQHFPKTMNLRGEGKNDWNFEYKDKPFDSNHWRELKHHQPFYAQVNFHETHRTFNGPQRADPNKVLIPPYYPDHPVVRDDWARYLDAAMELDRKVGLILDQLLSEGLADNTIVVFFADNGQAHVRGKQFCYDSGLLVPLIIFWPEKLKPPGDFRPQTVSDQLLEAIDLTAQTLNWAGIEKPINMQGRVFLGDNAEAERQLAFAARDRCDETPFRFRTARDARYRYIKNYTPDRPLMLHNQYKSMQYPAWDLIKQLSRTGKLTSTAQEFLVAPAMPQEELYDTITDPHETVNLNHSKEAEHQLALERLRTAVKGWILESNDAGQSDNYNYDPALAAKGD